MIVGIGFDVSVETCPQSVKKTEQAALQVCRVFFALSLTQATRENSEDLKIKCDTMVRRLCEQGVAFFS